MDERHETRGPDEPDDARRSIRRKRKRGSEPPPSAGPHDSTEPPEVPRDGAPASRHARQRVAPNGTPAVYEVEFDDGLVDPDGWFDTATKAT
jgi:hypothetical protein